MSTTATRELPIIMQAWEVRAILENRKTMTRRVIVPQPTLPVYHRLIHGGTGAIGGAWTATTDLCGNMETRYCSYKPGDHLWVRETWCEILHPDRQSFPCDTVTLYRADGESQFVDGIHVEIDRWCPSIHMPRRASRITLEVTAVRVERVQEIDEWGARKEGFTVAHDGPNIVASVRRQWNDDYAKRGYGWDSNPWVRVVEFKRLALTD